MINCIDTKEFSEALSIAQGKIKFAVIDSTNPHFKSRYSSLESHIDAIKPILESTGFSVIQSVSDSGNALHTTLIHATGRITTSIPLIIAKHDMQGLGSAITYARRYALAALFNIGSDIDDDANRSVAQTKQDPKPAIAFKKIETTKEEINLNRLNIPKVVSTEEANNIKPIEKEVSHIVEIKEPKKPIVNHAPKVSSDSEYRTDFSFGNYPKGIALRELGTKGVKDMQKTILIWTVKELEKGKVIPPPIQGFLDQAKVYLESE